MAAIGKIRSWGPVLVGVIGLALFAFIAEELFRSCDSMKNQERQQIGEVLGKKIDYQEYQKLFEEYQEVIKLTQGTDNLTDEQSNQVKDMVWNSYVQSVLIADEAEKLGLTVTDEEMMNIFKQGTNPMLMNTPFVNQQTGRFDLSLLQRFRNEYKNVAQQGQQVAEQYRSLNNYWTFIEKNIRQQTLAQKYQALLGACFLSNPVAAKAAFQAENEESDIELASIAYTTIKDDQVKVTDADLKAKYEEQKIRFNQLAETRDVKYVAIKVQASPTDRAKLDSDIKAFTAQLTEAADPTEVIRKSGSLVTYAGIPQTKAAFPFDIASKLDSMAVGSVSAPVVNSNDNTINVIKLMAKQQLPDSIEFRAITVAGADMAAVRKSADSIYNAIQGGADFEAVAKNYGQTGAKTWITSAQQNSSAGDKDTRTYIETLNTSEVNALKNLQLTNASLVLQVTARRAMTDKYTAAVIKKPITFSNETYNAAYNKFSQYVSENQTLEGLEKNAQKYGYTVEELSGIQSNVHYINNIRGTRDALKWLFEAKEGDVSPLYECGDNDQMLVLVCKNINKKGYTPYTNEQVNSYLKAEVIKDKKAEQIMAKLKGVNSIDAARKQGAIVTDVPQVTFAAPVYVQTTGASEPALGGAIAATKPGTFSKAPVKGNGGVYLFSVKNRKMREGAKFDEKAQEKQLQQRAAQRAMQMSMQQLYENADITDNRYLFF